MSRIHYLAKTADGRDETDFVEAESAAQAMQTLQSRGLHDIVLMQSPDLAAFNPDLPGLTSKQHARLRSEALSKPGFRAALLRMLRTNSATLVVGAGAALLGAWQHWPGLLLVGVLIFLFPFGFFFWKRRALDRYRALQTAYVDRRWDEVRKIAAGFVLKSDNLLVAWDVAVRVACIDARQGHLAEALASMEPWKPKIAAKTRGMFEARVASIYFAGGDYQGYLRLMEQASELSGHDPSRQVDVALAYAKFGDPRRAEEVLTSIDAKLLTPLAHKFATYIHGIAHLREGQAERAEPELRTAAEAFKQMSTTAASAWVGYATALGYLALAMARCGRRVEANDQIASVMPVLLAHADKPLLDQLQAEVLHAAA